MPKLLLDTDFIIKLANDPLPALSNFLSMEESEGEFSLWTISAVVSELRGLTLSTNPSTRRRAKFALSLVGSQIKVEKCPPNLGGEVRGGKEKENEKSASPTSSSSSSSLDAEADLLLVDCARSNQADMIVVATLDGKLLSKLGRMGLPYLTLRNNRPFLSLASRGGNVFNR